MNKIYKEFCRWKNMFIRGGKKGQITIFIIIAIVIVAGIVLFFAFTNSGRGLIDRVTGSEFDVRGNLDSCVSEIAVEESLGELMLQGGETEPQNSFTYKGNEIKYLCYTNANYDTCVMQEPLLLQGIENRLKAETEQDIENCVDSLNSQLESRGYNVNNGVLNYSLNIIPEDIIIKIDYPLTISRGGETRNFDREFEFRHESGAYNLILISTSILNFEARYGDSDPVSYMALYPNIKVEKLKQGDGTKIYILTDRETEEKFQFASRSVAFPAGYGY